MAQPVQTYKNHGRLLYPYHLFVVPVLGANVLVAVRNVWMMPSRRTLWALIVAAALATLAVVTRSMVLTVQNRVIRHEMRVRLRDCVPADLRGRINDLTTGQLIAMRFAGDAEMADIMRDVLAGKLATKKEIKMRVKDWQADWLRA